MGWYGGSDGAVLARHKTRRDREPRGGGTAQGITAKAFAVRVGQSIAWLADALVMQILLARPLHPPINRGGPAGRLPNDPGNYDAPSYPAERRQRAQEHMRLQRRQRSLRDIWRDPTASGSTDDGGDRPRTSSSP